MKKPNLVKPCLAIKNKLFYGICLTAMLTTSNIASAVLAPITTDLTISGSGTINPVYPAANTTQTGWVTATVGGSLLTSSFDESAVPSPALPPSIPFMHIGDGLSIGTTLQAGDDGDYAYIADYTMSFVNHSSDDYKIIVNYFFDHEVDADGNSAFAQSNIDIEENGIDIPRTPSSVGGFSEIYSETDAEIDEDTLNGVLLGTNGEIVSDTESLPFEFIVLAGKTSVFSSIWDWEGFVDGTGTSTVDFSANIEIASVINLTAVPLPGAMVFFISGLLGLSATKLRRIQL